MINVMVVETMIIENLWCMIQHMICRSKRVGCKLLSVWTPPMAFNKLNFDGCALGNPGQLRIESMVRDRYGTVPRVFSKLAGKWLAIEIEIGALLKSLLQVKALDPFQFISGGGFLL